MHILQCMGSKFYVKSQRAHLKFHTKFWTHTLQNMQFTVINFCVWVTMSLNCDVKSLRETGPCCQSGILENKGKYIGTWSKIYQAQIMCIFLVMQCVCCTRYRCNTLTLFILGANSRSNGQRIDIILFTIPLPYVWMIGRNHPTYIWS